MVTSDGGRVTVALKTATFDSAYVEFEGIVDAPNQLREEARCEFGSSFGKPPDALPEIRLLQPCPGTQLQLQHTQGQDLLEAVWQLQGSIPSDCGDRNPTGVLDLCIPVPCSSVKSALVHCHMLYRNETGPALKSLSCVQRALHPFWKSSFMFTIRSGFPVTETGLHMCHAC